MVNDVFSHRADSTIARKLSERLLADVSIDGFALFDLKGQSHWKYQVDSLHTIDFFNFALGLHPEPDSGTSGIFMYHDAELHLFSARTVFDPEDEISPVDFYLITQQKVRMDKGKVAVNLTQQHFSDCQVVIVVRDE